MATTALSRWQPTRWLRAFMVAAAMLAASLSGAESADPTPDQLRDRFDGLIRELDKILRDIDRTKSGFKAVYDCPPSESKKQDNEDLQQIRRRLNAAVTDLGGQGRRDGIVEFNEKVGPVGQGQGLDRYLEGRSSAQDNLTIPQGKIAEARSKVQQARNALGSAQLDLNGRPKTERECDARFDPIQTINWNPGSAEPGDMVNSVVTATTRSGKAVTITSVTANVGSVSSGGANVGGMGAAVNVGFKIDDVKRQGPHQLSITVAGRPAGLAASAGSTSTTLRINNYMVKNVAPTVAGLPTGPEKEPGEELKLDGPLTIIDRNADSGNAAEITAAKITFMGHPTDLDTNPGSAFASNTQARLVGRHDPTTGTYNFDITRKANAKKPHRHGVFPVKIRIEDKEGKTVETAEIKITIKNVAPKCTLKVDPKRKYHSNDGIQVVLSGSAHDDNGKADLEKIEVDATGAGGGLYTKANGKLVLTEDGDTGYTFVTKPPSFGHPNNRGIYPIPAFAEDNGAPEQGQNTPEKTNCDKDIEVGNDPPYGSGSGFIYEREPGDQRRICPNETFRAGAIFVDPEEDTLVVKAQIGEMKAGGFVAIGGAVTMTGSPNSHTYVADLRAPPRPGRYVIRFTAVEKDQNPPLSAEQEIDLIVDPCPGDEIAMIEPPEEDKPATTPGVCMAPTDDQKAQLAGTAIGTWTAVNDAAVQVADASPGDWGLTAGLRYSPTDSMTIKFGPIVNMGAYSVGVKEGIADATVDQEFKSIFNDLNIPLADPVSSGDLLELSGFGGTSMAQPHAAGMGSLITPVLGHLGDTGTGSVGYRQNSVPDLFGTATATAPEGGSVFGDRLRLNFDTSFTGKDRLRVRLEQSPVVEFVEPGFCRIELEQGAAARMVGEVRPVAPSAEQFLRDPNALRNWNPGTDGSLPQVKELKGDGSGLIDLLNKAAPGYDCTTPLEVVLADSMCNTSKTRIGPVGR